MADVTMPQLGETVTEGTITRWIKSVGEQVTRDEPLFEVSTDKVDSEVPAPASGVLSEILVPEGETVEVGARLAVIGDGAAAGAAPGAPAAAAAETTAPAEDREAPSEAPPATGAVAPPAVSNGAPAPSEAPAPPAPPPAPAAATAETRPPGPPPAAPARPSATPSPSGDGGPPPPPAGYVARPSEPGTGGGAPAPGAGAVPGAPGAPGAEALLLSPVVRRLLEESGLSPSDVAGTGIGGRITREDVLHEIDARRTAGAAAPSAPLAPPPAPPAVTPQTPQAAQAPPPAPPAAPPQAAPAPPPQAPPAAPAAPPAAPPAAAPAPAQPPAPAVAQPPAAAAQTAVMRSYGDRVVPFSNMRRRTAEHMLRSKATSPHAFIAYEVDFENVDRVRRAWSERFKAEEGFPLTYLPFVARATVEALREYPQLNSSVVDDSLVVHQQINLGIAVDLNHEGLIVPVVHRAEEITLRGIARRVRDIADRARNRQLTADDIAGGTFSITNDGPYGTYFTVPIINQPQVAILATDGIRRRPVVLTATDGSESLAIHSVGMVGMSWDHRAVDGAYVSAFLRRLADVIDTRDWFAEL